MRWALLCVTLVMVGGLGRPNSVYGREAQGSDYPQRRVDEAVLEQWRQRTAPNAATPAADVASPFAVCRNSVASLAEPHLVEPRFLELPDSSSTLYVGPGADTLFIDVDDAHDGDLVIFGDGVLIVDNACLTLRGHLYQQDNGTAILRNGAYLHVPQEYNAQYLHLLHDNARFQADSATVFANTVHQIRHYGQSEYIARQTDFPHWNYHRLWDSSKLILEDAKMVGDLQINDSCEVSFTRCDTIMPWLGVASGESVDLSFPDWELVPDYTFDSNLAGVDGIDYSVTFDSCGMVMWGIESWPGSSIHIWDTSFLGVPLRIFEDIAMEDIHDYTVYADLSFPFADRECRLTDTYLHFWFPYAYEQAVVDIESCRFAESKAYDDSEIHASSTIADGLPSSATAQDNGFFCFADGECRTFTSSWHNATLLLINTSVVPRPRSSQLTNLAHGHSRYLAVNCHFDFEPQALDTALVVVAALDPGPSNTAGTCVDIPGSAWISTGPHSPIKFDRYRVYWSDHDSFSWTLIGEAADSVHGGVLATWDTSGREGGDYDLRLTVWDTAQDSLTALAMITLQEPSTTDEREGGSAGLVLLHNCPNPFTPQTRFIYELPAGGDVVLTIFDQSGRQVKTWTMDAQPAGRHSIAWDGTDAGGGSVGSGVYFYRLTGPGCPAAGRCSIVR